MHPIKKINGIITNYVDLSPTARDIEITLDDSLPCIAGCFVNLFITHNGTILRRAFSVSASDTTSHTITVSIRCNPNGQVTPLFWKEDIVGTPVSVMGPLGLNTADKMHSDRIFLFGYGIGAGVVKALATYFTHTESIKEILIMTGNRSEQEILHKEFFDTLAMTHPQVQAHYVVSNTAGSSTYPTGYIQDHISTMNFSHADVYVCGQEIACHALVDTVKKSKPINTNFFVEGFH